MLLTKRSPVKNERTNKQTNKQTTFKIRWKTNPNRSIKITHEVIFLGEFHWLKEK
jgi:hypothetical protein